MELYGEVSADQNTVVFDKNTEMEIITTEQNNCEDEDVDQMAKLFERFRIGGPEVNGVGFVGFDEQTNTLKQIIDLKLK